MNRRITFALIFSGIFITASAQEDYDLRKNISDHMDSMISIFQRRDWKSYTDYMLPALIDGRGGKESFVKFMEEQMSIYDSLHIDIYKKGKILQVVKKDSGYQCITESFQQLSGYGMINSGSSYDIGISSDGKRWYFLRLEERSPILYSLIPNLSPELKLPATQFENKSLEEFLKTYKIRFLE